MALPLPWTPCALPPPTGGLAPRVRLHALHAAPEENAADRLLLGAPEIAQRASVAPRAHIVRAVLSAEAAEFSPWQSWGGRWTFL